MMREGRGRLASEGGFISVGAAIALALLALVIYIVAAGFGGDTAQFGSSSIPGSATVELPEGSVDVYYAEGVSPDSDVPVIVPADLEYTVSDPDGNFVQVDTRGGEEAKETDGGKALLIGELQAPAEGPYTVESESDDVQQRITPALTFGEGSFAAMGARAESVLDTLKGPVGILVLLAIVILIFIPRYRRAKKRQTYKDMP